MPCCQQWRKRALTYLLDEKTLYKLANLIFNSSSVKWKTSFQKLMDKGDRSKVNQIVVSASILCMLVSLYHSNYYYCPIILPKVFVIFTTGTTFRSYAVYNCHVISGIKLLRSSWNHVNVFLVQEMH